MDPQNAQTTEVALDSMQAASQTAGTGDLMLTLLFLVLAGLASWGLGRIAKLPGLRHLRRWFELARVIIWASITLEVAFTISRMVTDNWLLVGLLLLALVAMAGFDWLRNISAGLALAFERRFEVGDVVRYQDVEGELTEMGIRAVTLRAADGTFHQIPNVNFTSASVTNLQAEGEAACEIVVSVPAGVSPQRAAKLAREAAFLTPLASPRHRPEAFLDVGDPASTNVELRVRGFAFDPAHREHYRSDVVARIHDMLRIEESVKA